MAQIRGLFTFSGTLFAVSGDQLLRIDGAGATTVVGTIGSAGGPVDMEQNLQQLCISDGTALYVWDGISLTRNADWVPGDRIAFVDQRIVGVQRGGQKFGWTALGDAKSVSALDFYSAEGSPDGLVAVLSSQRELLLLGEYSAEVWYSVGGTDVFQRAQSEFIQYGCAAAFSAHICGDTPVWLGRDRQGQARVLAGRGQRISTRAIEERFDGRNLKYARAYSYSDGPHTFYCLNVPGVDTTLVYDLAFKQWHERAELVNGAYRQWRATCHAFAYGSHFFGADDGRIFRLNRDAHTFAGSPKVRDRITPVASSPARKRLRFPSFELVSEKAGGKEALLRWSDDNGATWSNWQRASTGATGEHARRVRWMRLGSAYDRVFQVRMTDDAPFNPVQATVEAV